MPKRHLDWGQVRQALAGEIGPWELIRSLLRHLVEVCPQCQRRWAQQAKGTGGPDAELARLEYAAAFRSVLEQLPARCLDLDRERAEAPALIEELCGLKNEEEQIRRMEEEPRFHTWGLCDLLIEESRQAAFEDPAIAQLFARLALALVERLDPWRYGAGFLEDVRGLGWAFFANGLRVASDLRGADDAMERAKQAIGRGAGDPLVVAQVLTLEASLRRGQRRFEEARDLLDEVIYLYRETGEQHLQGKATVTKAIGLCHLGESRQALPLLRQAVGLIDPRRDTRLQLCAQHNLACCLLDCNRPKEARKLLERIRPDYAEYPDFWTQLRLAWVEGKLAAAEERCGDAEAFLREARDGFLKHEVGYDAALVSLDLAMLYLDHGRHAEVIALAQEMFPIFQSRDVHREAVAALLIFQKAAMSQSLTTGTIDGIAAYLRRARHDPSHPFEKPS